MLINNYLLHTNLYDVEDAKATVIITHGIAEHSGRYKNIINKLNDEKYRVFTYDIRGHGRSEGKRGFINSYLDYVNDLHEIKNYVLENYGDNIFMIGHSLGGAITHLYTVTFNDVKGVITSGAPSEIMKELWPFKIFGTRILRRIKFKTNFADQNLSSIEKVTEDYLNDPLNLPYFTLSVPGQVLFKGMKYLRKNIFNYKTPILLLHGEKDVIVPPYNSKNLYDKIPSKDKKLIIYKNSYHEIFNDVEEEKVYEDIVKWLDERI